MAPDPPRTDRPGRGILALVVTVVAVTGAGLRPFSFPEELLVAAAIAVTGWGLLSPPPARTTAVRGPARLGAAWAAAAGLLAAVELLSYLAGPRARHPTLSSMADAAMDLFPGRAALLAVWLLAGWWAFWPGARTSSGTR